MNDIDRWFARAARRENRAVSLYTYLLTGRIFAYFRYRMRFALLLDATGFVIHVAEFLILLTTLGGLAAFTVMILRIGSMIVGGAWWGLLEVMRERLRVYAQVGNRDAAEREIGSWLVLSVIVAAVVAIAGAVVLAVMLPTDQDRVGHLYAFLVVVELALRLPVRVLHSGVFATRRIHRPLWSMFAPTVTQLLVIGVGALVYPTAAIVVAIVAANAIGIWITVHYTLSAYRLSGMWPNYRRRGHSLPDMLPSIPLGLGFQSALAGFGLRLDAVAVLAIAGIYGTSTRAFDLAAGYSAWRDIDLVLFFYLVLPLFRGAYESTGVFYFDFVRLRRIPALREFRLSFFHRLLLATPIVTLYFWSLAVVLGMFVLPDIPFTFLAALLPLFLVRSFIGVYQFRLFAEGQFRTLNATILLSVALFGLVWIDVNPASDLVQITAAMITLLIVHINIQHFQDRTSPTPTLLTLGDWIRTLDREPGPIRAGRLTIPEWIPSRQRTAAVRMMYQLVDGTGCLAFRSATTLLYYQRVSATTAVPGDDRRPSHLALQQATGGAVNRGQSWTDPTENGSQALDRVLADRWVEPIEDVLMPPDDPHELRAAFLDAVPDGIAFDLDTRAGTRDMRSLDHHLLVGLLPAAMKSLDNGALVIPVSGRWLSPVFYRGRLRLLFLLPADTPPAIFRHWMQIMKAWHVGSRASEGVSRAAVG
ncbi:MAG: hypothetical protein JST91_21555 [Actinobacteria bacterium]|nr:hypothetical protein [Actinomycetota bacterium]